MCTSIKAFNLYETCVLESYGVGDYVEYRIPGIVITEKGTLLCCYEARKDCGNDWAQIDLIIARSIDEGKNFVKTKVAFTQENKEICTYNNPVLIADKDRIHFIYHKDYEKAYYCYSEDDGISFSEPVEITKAFEEFEYDWNVCASGPGHGIVTNEGRLVVPIWLANGEVIDAAGRMKNHAPSTAGAIYSNDRGKTWHAGVLVEGLHNANETTIVQLSNGKILFNFRSYEYYRTLGISKDGIEDFDKVWTENQLPDPWCFGAMTSTPSKGLLFVNCANQYQDPQRGTRIDLTVYESMDDGQSWEKAILVDAQGGYADIAIDKTGLYVFYEQCPWDPQTGHKVSQLILKRYSSLNF